MLRRSNKLIVTELNQSLWQEWLGRTRHDLFHTPQYHRVQAEPDRSLAYLAAYGTPDKFLVLPYLLKPISMGGAADCGLREVTSVYGYSGSLAYNADNDDDFLNEAWRAISANWGDQGAARRPLVRIQPTDTAGSSPLCE